MTNQYDGKGSGSVFVTSHNQSGGITAHTVNLGPAARQMNDQLGSQLLEAIPKSSKVSVVCTLGDGEAFVFANQVLSWLRTAGYSNLSGVDQAVYSGPVNGQNINKRAENDFEIIIGTRQP